MRHGAHFLVALLGLLVLPLRYPYHSFIRNRPLIGQTPPWAGLMESRDRINSEVSATKKRDKKGALLAFK
jgi:hypothetical protein